MANHSKKLNGKTVFGRLDALVRILNEPMPRNANAQEVRKIFAERDNARADIQDLLARFYGDEYAMREISQHIRRQRRGEKIWAEVRPEEVGFFGPFVYARLRELRERML
jgi:hypothetical protein